MRQDIVKLVYVPVYKKISDLNPQTRKPDWGLLFLPKNINIAGPSGRAV